jgi:hypothetical protein
MEQAKKRHHFLPVFYLQGFTEPDSKRLWIYEKGNPIVRLSTPENEGCQKFYHAFITHEGNRDTDTIENYFEKIETETGKLLIKIHRREILAEQDRKYLALFVSFMRTRTPLFRNDIEKMAAEHIKHVGLDSAKRNFKESLDTI